MQSSNHSSNIETLGRSPTNSMDQQLLSACTTSSNYIRLWIFLNNTNVHEIPLSSAKKNGITSQGPAAWTRNLDINFSSFKNVYSFVANQQTISIIIEPTTTWMTIIKNKFRSSHQNQNTTIRASTSLYSISWICVGLVQPGSRTSAIK